MSEPESQSPAPAVPPSRNSMMRFLILIAGMVAVVLGVRQFRSGVDGIRMDADVERLTKECDAAFHEANDDLKKAAPMLEAVLNAVDSNGLEVTRREKRADVEQALKLYTSATANLRLAGEKAEEAAAKKPGEKMEQFLKVRAEACRGYAQSRELSMEVARMVLDEKILTTEELAKRVTDNMVQAGKLEEAANAKVLEADRIVEQFKK